MVAQLDEERNLVTFDKMRAYVPEFGSDDLTRPWSHRFPRCLKTHKRRWPLFANHKSILVLRDPRETSVSFFHYEVSKKNPRFQGDFATFVRHPKFGIDAYYQHLASWKDHATVIVKYEDLKKDDVAGFSTMLKTLEIAVPEKVIVAATEASRFDKLKAIEKEHGRVKDVSQLKHKDEYAFMRSGKTNSWRDLFNEADLEYTKSVANKYQFPHYDLKTT
jgi:hypothetical protein